MSRSVPSNHSTVLAASGLMKVYGKRTVVDGVSFEVHQGEVVGLLGPNGAGKTTSFRMTCGLISANAGEVYLGGNNVSDWPMYRRAGEGKMGYLPQDRSVFGSLSTEKNLYMAMELLGIPRSKQRRRCDELLRKFNLLHVRKTIVGSGGTGGLSGGERRRLEIARALLSEPRILLLDEPFANVDPNTVTEIQNVVRELSSEGIAILITDHQIDATMEIAHHCYVIYSGKVLCSGGPVEVLSHPEARRLYFGEKSQQQLENLVKKIRKSGAGTPFHHPTWGAAHEWDASEDAPDEGDPRRPSGGPTVKRDGMSGGPQRPIRPARGGKGTGYVVEEDVEEEIASFRTDRDEEIPPVGGMNRPPRERPSRPDRRAGGTFSRKTDPLDEYLDDEELLPPDRKSPPSRSEDRYGRPRKRG